MMPENGASTTKGAPYRYEEALTNADNDTVMSLCADGVIFIALPAVGREAVLSAYRHLFGNIRLSIDSKIDEVVMLSPYWAYSSVGACALGIDSKVAPAGSYAASR